MSPTEPAAIVEGLRAAFEAGTTTTVRWRREQLLGLQRMLGEQERRFTDALEADLGKSATEAYLTEIGVTNSGLDHILRHLDNWMLPTRVKVPVTQKPGRAEIVHEPLGVVAVIAPWNYPVHLVIAPLAAALSAGNAVLVTPSELAPATSAVLADVIPQYLDTSGVAVLEGGPDVTQAMLEQRFDHIFFTGSARIGRTVMAAAAQHLTPVTLELGGKSPAIVHRSANLGVAARRITLGRFLNAGQTCIAPDYVLVDQAVEEELVALIAGNVRDFFGKEPKDSTDFGRIIDERHVQRLRGLIEGGGYDEVVVGGDTDVAARYVAPTVLRGVSPDAPVMGEEIFGPILPVLAMPSIDDSIRFVNARPKPLSLYVFAEDDDAAEQVVTQTSSGGVCVNHTLVHYAVPELPFGGVGDSGFGAYHGWFGFETFSHKKSVLRKPSRPDPSVLYPPYGRVKARMLRTAL
jgi:aldehyde dehydrogenase (NAD+)